MRRRRRICRARLEKEVTLLVSRRMIPSITLANSNLGGVEYIKKEAPRGIGDVRDY